MYGGDNHAEPWLEVTTVSMLFEPVCTVFSAVFLVVSTTSGTGHPYSKVRWEGGVRRVIMLAGLTFVDLFFPALLALTLLIEWSVRIFGTPLGWHSWKQVRDLPRCRSQSGGMSGDWRRPRPQIRIGDGWSWHGPHKWYQSEVRRLRE